MQSNIRRTSCGENGKAEARAAAILAAESDVLFCAVAYWRVLRVYEDRVSITLDTNIMTSLFVPTSRGTKAFGYDVITSLHFTPANTALSGHLDIEYPGRTSQETENRFPFTNRMLPVMETVHQYISRRMKEVKATAKAPAAPTISAADELLKFKQLLDMGAITQAEFDQKKKQLLGL